MYTELTWIRENGHLNHVDENVQRVLGWTAEEMMARPASDFMTVASYSKFKTHYLSGPANTIMPRTLTLDIRHKDGYTIEMRLSIVCRYDKQGQLAEAYGSAHCCVQHQEEQDKMMKWWRVAETEAAEALGALIHTAEMIRAAA